MAGTKEGTHLVLCTAGRAPNRTAWHLQIAWRENELTTL